MRAPAVHALLALAALVLAGCAAPAAKQPLAATLPPAEVAGLDPGSPASGGRILNTPPRVVAFDGSAARADNGGGSSEVFRALLADDNAEGDLASLLLAAEGPQRLQLTASIGSRLPSSEPPLASAGWAVWDAVPHDGLLNVAVRALYPYGAEPGEYRWTLTVRDAGNLAGRSAEDLTLVEPVHVVEVEGAVAPDGSPVPADGWGGWAAEPGARDVTSVTFLKVVNGGTQAEQRFLVDFTSRDFVGDRDASWRVPLDGNVRFAAWEALPGQAPRDGTFVFGDPSPDGSATFQFTRPGSVLYVAYQVVQVPSPLPSQMYHASATVTAL